MMCAGGDAVCGYRYSSKFCGLSQDVELSVGFWRLLKIH